MPDVTHPGLARTYGPAVAAYVVATAATGAYLWGDSVDYADEVHVGAHFWEFGHLFWRPLGTLLAAIVPASPGPKTNLVLLLAVCWLSGLGCVVWLRGLLRWAGLRGWPADLAVVGLLVSQAFLNYAQTACSYVPGLAMLLLGCYLLARATAKERPSNWDGIGAGAALAAAVCFWFVYVWGLPAAVLLPLFLGGPDRARVRLAARAGLACVLFTALCYSIPLAALHITSVEALRAWIAEASHGIVGVSGAPRALFGLPRSFLSMGADGVLFKRHLLHDPLNPTSAGDLVRHSLWKLVLFYLFLLALVVGLARSPRGRRLLGLLAAGAVPTFGFAVAWQGGDLERYLPLYPFLFLAVAGLFALERVPLVCRAMAVAFFLAAAASNVAVMARPLLQREQQRLAARVEGLGPLLKPESRVFFVRDEIGRLDRDFPLPAREDLSLLEAATPGLAETPRWREVLARRILDVWGKGGDAWFARRLLAEGPRREWNWVEGDDPALSWRDLHAFFKALETDEEVGGDDGFLRVKVSPANRRRLREVAKPPAPSSSRGEGLGQRRADQRFAQDPARLRRPPLASPALPGRRQRPPRGPGAEVARRPLAVDARLPGSQRRRAEQRRVPPHDAQHVAAIVIDVAARQGAGLQHRGSQRLPGQVDRRRQDQAGPQIDVLRGAQRRVEALRPHHGTANQHRRGPDALGHQQRLGAARRHDAVEELGLPAFRFRARPFRHLFVETTARQADLGMTGQKVELPFQFVRLPVVVGVEKGDQVAARFFEAAVAGAGGAAVRLANQPHPLPERGEGGRHVVGAAVVDDDDLIGGGRLGQQTGERPADDAGGPVGRDNDADRRPAHPVVLHEAVSSDSGGRFFSARTTNCRNRSARA